MKESSIMKRLQVNASKLGARVLRNNVGMAWTGQAQHIGVMTNVTLKPGDLILRSAVPIKFGLGVGSSDLIGWQSATITPDMVGKLFARFVALEIKTDKGKPTDEQLQFLTAIKIAGGIAGIARNEDDLKELLTKTADKPVTTVYISTVTES